MKKTFNVYFKTQQAPPPLPPKLRKLCYMIYKSQ